jgi:hypothetical protein
VVCVAFAVLSEHLSVKHTVFISLVGVEGYVWDSEVDSLECTRVDEKLLNRGIFFSENRIYLVFHAVTL